MKRNPSRTPLFLSLFLLRHAQGQCCGVVCRELAVCRPSRLHSDQPLKTKNSDHNKQRQRQLNPAILWTGARTFPHSFPVVFPLQSMHGNCMKREKKPLSSYIFPTSFFLPFRSLHRRRHRYLLLPTALLCSC